MSTPHTSTPQTSTQRTTPLDTTQLRQKLLGRWGSERLRAREVACRPEFHKHEDLSVDAHRERVFEQLKGLVDAQAVHRAFPSRFGGEDNHGGNVAGFEELVIADPSLQIKAGVQWGLFGAAVLHLGTEEHHEAWLPGILNLDIPGCFAMTETGHGSDVASIGTTATYDPDNQEFIIHTPHRAAWKDYIGNAARDGRAAVVFAHLITQGVDHGVHAFYVDLRDEKGNFLPGIGGEDDGVKGGLNGIDNGRLHFDQVRIPRTNLLNRYGDVSSEGAYTSSISSPGRRFFTMLGTLVQGRVSLDGAASAASKIALSAALHYASERRQFTAGSPVQEEVLLDYQQHQLRLLPLLASTYAISFAHEELLEKFDAVFSGRGDTEQDRQDLETLAAGLKALSTWHALDTLQEAREACGGAGFLMTNRFASLRADLDIYTTFEGDNTVLLQLVGKRLLTDYAGKFAGADAKQVAKLILGQKVEDAVSVSGLRQVAQAVKDTGSAKKSSAAFSDPAYVRYLLSTREQTLVAEIGQKLAAVRKKSAQVQADVFNSVQAKLIEAAKAHVELVQFDAFCAGVASLEDPQTKRVLTWLRDLFGLGLLEKHLDWYLINTYLSGQRARALKERILHLLTRLRPYALDLVDAFGYDDDAIRVEIASGAEQNRQQEAEDYARTRRAAKDAPVEEKYLTKAADKVKGKAGATV